MNAQPGQIKDIFKALGATGKVKIIAEAGNDNGNTFLGDFLFEYKDGRTKKIGRINNEKLIKQ